MRTELGEPIIVDPRRGLHDVTNPGLHDGREDAWKNQFTGNPCLILELDSLGRVVAGGAHQEGFFGPLLRHVAPDHLADVATGKKEGTLDSLVLINDTRRPVAEFTGLGVRGYASRPK